MKGLLSKSIVAVLMCVAFISCKKNDPISELGDSNGEFFAKLTVSYNTNKPAFGDTVVVTASTWQRDDKIAKVEMIETVVEVFGLNFVLNKGTAINTYDIDNKVSLLVITDSISKGNPWFEIVNNNNQLNQYFVTLSNNYVIRAFYPFVQQEGNYANDVNVIDDLSDGEFDVIKSILAYRISQADYKAIFPTAPASDLSSGTYALSSGGMDNLRANLTKSLLIQNMASCEKSGTYTAQLVTNVITPSGALTSTNNSFQVML